MNDRRQRARSSRENGARGGAARSGMEARTYPGPLALQGIYVNTGATSGKRVHVTSTTSQTASHS
jgi:hypothetical protein